MRTVYLYWILMLTNDNNTIMVNDNKVNIIKNNNKYLLIIEDKSVMVNNLTIKEVGIANKKIIKLTSVLNKINDKEVEMLEYNKPYCKFERLETELSDEDKAMILMSNLHETGFL